MATNPLGHLAVTVLGVLPPSAVTDTTLSPGFLLLCAIGATTISAIAAVATDAAKAAFHAFT
jgi:hypothetical protein